MHAWLLSLSIVLHIWRVKLYGLEELVHLQLCPICCTISKYQSSKLTINGDKQLQSKSDLFLWSNQGLVCLLFLAFFFRCIDNFVDLIVTSFFILFCIRQIPGQCQKNLINLIYLSIGYLSFFFGLFFRNLFFHSIFVILTFQYMGIWE